MKLQVRDTDFQELDNDELNALENGRFATLTLAEKKELRQVLFDKRDRIDNQIEEAKSRAHNGGGYADHEWYTRATRALKHTQRQLGKLNGIIADEQHELRQMERHTFETAFMTVCRESLEQGVFQSLFAQAEIYMNGGNGRA